MTPMTAWRSDFQELLSSMRFAIALLTLIGISSIIGTVVKQGESQVNYIDAFGPFWTQVFNQLGLFRIYSATWFLLILFFLVLSTSLCIFRNAPKFWADFKSFKENIRVPALQAFHHKAQGQTHLPILAAQEQVTQALTSLGWQIKSQHRQESTKSAEIGVMLAARKGQANRLGYISAHLSVVLICVGGLLDGDLISSLQVKWNNLTPYLAGNDLSKHSLSTQNPSFRAQLFVPEGQQSKQSIVNLAQGMFIQPLPFEVELKKFKVDYYETGMPKRFASDVVIHDFQDNSQHNATIEVNRPFVYKGYTIFQSGFEDGGSALDLKPIPLTKPDLSDPATKTILESSISLIVGQNGIALPSALTANQEMRIEPTALRPINVHDLVDINNRPIESTSNKTWSRFLGSGNRKDNAKQLINVGPSVSYKLRDNANQAREYQNYMLPVHINNIPMFLLGAREVSNEPFKFLRVPADENMQIMGWIRLKQALSDANQRQRAAQLLAENMTSNSQKVTGLQLETTALQLLDLFSGHSRHATDNSVKQISESGFDALTSFIDKAVPTAEQNQVAQTLLRLLNSALFVLNNLARQQDGLPALPAQSQSTADFMTQAVVALSDSFHYPASIIFMPNTFEHKQASVFQVTRTPGQTLVYLGCVCLIVGVFTMLYIRERRVWVWLENEKWSLALSSTRQTLDIDNEFDHLRQRITNILQKMDRP